MTEHPFNDDMLSDSRVRRIFRPEQEPEVYQYDGFLMVAYTPRDKVAED